MEITGFCDWREIKEAFRIGTSDTRFESSRFASAARKANGEILDALRPRYAVDDLFLANQTTEAISGVTTSEGTNEIKLSTGTWAVNAFAESSFGLPLEVVIYKDATPAFWVADVVSNTAIAITISDIDGGSITVPSGANFYLRIKLPGLQSIGLAFGMYYWLINNRTSQGINVSPQALLDKKNAEAQNLGMYIGGALALVRPKKTDAITLSGATWKRLSKSNIDPGSIVVTYSSATYYTEQGFEIDYVDGRIRYRTPDSDQTTLLPSGAAISVVYRYMLRGNVSGAV